MEIVRKEHKLCLCCMDEHEVSYVRIKETNIFKGVIMKVKNLNSSSKKTKQLIKENFIDLLFEEGDIQKVKVTELVKRANIDRTTFYSHYDNIYALAQDFEDEFLDLIDFEINNINSYEDLFMFFDKLKNIVKTGENRYKMAAASNFHFHFYH